MKRSGLLVLASIVLLASAGAVPGFAADLPVPATSYYPPAPLPPAHYDWTGFYFGAQVGADLLEDKVTPATSSSPTVVTGSTTVDPYDVIGGGQIGFNYQFAPVVIGIEGSWMATNLSGAGIAPIVSSTITGANGERATDAPTWVASATGRIGYAADTLLIYAKGGGAWMHVDYDQDILINGVTATSQSFSDTRSGFTAGAGIEYGMTENLSARLEYDFFDFGSKTYNFNQTPFSIKSDLHVFTVGLNYRFNWPGR